MTATKHKRRSGNPAKPPKPQYRPGSGIGTTGSQCSASSVPPR